MSVIVPTIPKSGSWLAVRGNSVRWAVFERVDIPADVAGTAAGATLAAGIDGVAIASDADAICPS
jgi:hypothetical protein